VKVSVAGLLLPNIRGTGCLLERSAAQRRRSAS